MARPKKLTLKAPGKSTLMKQGAALGLDNALIIKLLELLGPQLLSLILKWLSPLPKPGVSYIGDTEGDFVTSSKSIKEVFVDFIVNSRDEILGWVEEGEGALYDALTALVGSKSAGLAILLTQYKNTILHLDDTIESEVLDRIIEVLKNAD